MLERIYAAAQRVGFAKVATWKGETSPVQFDNPDSELLSGMVLATETTIRFPANRFVGIAQGAVIVIDGVSYTVRDVRAEVDGSEMRAKLSKK